MSLELSIIVPVYNMAADRKLQFCLDSLINQTLEKYEIIAVDDASTDDSLSVLREYEKKHPELIKVVASPVNRKQGGAKNAGLKQAKGQWIGFIDSDDWVTPDYYEKLLEKAKQTGADLVGCDYSLVSEHTFVPGKVVQTNTLDQTGVLDEEKHRKLVIRSGSMVLKIYKADVIRENELNFPEDIFYEDNCAGPLWSFYFKHFEKIEEPLYYYYQHESSTVHLITKKKCEDRKKAAMLLWEECKKRGFLETYGKEIEYRFTELYYTNTLFSYLQGTKHPSFSYVKELREGLMKLFPDFDQNPYFLEYTGKEEQKLIQMQKKSDLLFYLYYRLQLLVRRARTKKDSRPKK